MWGWIRGFIIAIAVLIAVLIGVGVASPAWATTPPAATTVLTSELLQDQLASPEPQGGYTVLNLSHFIIDLTPENSEFREEFYQRIQNKLKNANVPLGLDLRQSIIKGPFQLQRLTMKTATVYETLKTVLNAMELQRLQDQFSLFPDNNEGYKVNYLHLFRSPLLLEGTEFQEDATFTNVVFLHPIEGEQTKFNQLNDWSGSTFLRSVNFGKTRFFGDVSFIRCRFVRNARFEDAQFKENVKFGEAIFQDKGLFNRASFFGVADWQNSQWEGEGSFQQVVWNNRVMFNKSRFLGLLDFNNSTFEEAAAFRSSRFNQKIDFTEVSLLDQIDFSDAVFTSQAKLVVSGLAFDSDDAKIFGDKGQIGQVISVPSLPGNENTLRNLVRNFRKLEQIPDANQVDYTLKQLQLEEITTRIVGTPVNWAFLWRRGADLLNWLRLSVLLLLSEYGTNFNLILSVGGVAIAYFSLLFWLIDRCRYKFPSPILPSGVEIRWMVGSFMVLLGLSLVGILHSSKSPYFSLLCVGVILLPFPLGLVWRLYQKGRYHPLLDYPYIMENGAERQLRISIGSLPILPKFAFYRDRYTYIPWNRGWNWLNYYGFSLNNFLKLSFNDLRVRDEHLPGIVSVLVWYQWGLGICYIALLFWTLSRTIPGLNLLLYLS
ncbi:pentapeptide repeat-containing protein [Spirulina sp. CS-785/01]|uniref:pentapeptide repeat-containing protein n=1 Tax=Spirulina sp. CS-785/01 TaxID=3021716 RepID=UPI00232E7422|nr:pentapeptide repeat-containing protein [Spirulina sp. CS-785/01]MDB9315370.1 pentapeptide repeat-containing protein [Spirulina sp. CS-785/01]